MSAKNFDRKNRFRSKTIGFRVSPEEDAQINIAVSLSGLTKQDYIVKRLECKDIIVQGNTRVYKALRNELGAVLEELKRIENGNSSIDKFKINAYVYNEYFQTLTLVVSLFNNRAGIEKINKSEAEKACKMALKFIKMCCSSSNSFSDMEESSDSYQLFEYITKIISSIDNVSIILVTNKQLKSRDIPEDTAVNKIPVKYDIWDIERLAKAVFQKKDTSPLIIRFKTKYKDNLQLIRIPQESDVYDSYVGYISGMRLAEIYRDEGQRLIEKNVRSFLQATGKVNRGIRDTLKKNPDMFMAYNNGISTIAERIVFDGEADDRNLIVKVKELIGWQIVNGGQTTASIYTALQNKIPLLFIII